MNKLCQAFVRQILVFLENNPKFAKTWSLTYNFFSIQGEI